MATRHLYNVLQSMETQLLLNSGLIVIASYPPICEDMPRG